MVTYCIGSARQKRAYFQAGDYVLLDNEEVVFCASENGFNYFAYGAPPFSAFAVREYLDYMRALCPHKVTDADITRFGLDPAARLCALSPVKRRALSYLEKTGGKSELTPGINLDGTRYSMRARRELKKLVREIGDCCVCVSDLRFLRHAERGARVLKFGKSVKRGRPKFFAAKRLAGELGITRIAVF